MYVYLYMHSIRAFFSAFKSFIPSIVNAYVFMCCTDIASNVQIHIHIQQHLYLYMHSIRAFFSAFKSFIPSIVNAQILSKSEGRVF